MLLTSKTFVLSDFRKRKSFAPENGESTGRRPSAPSVYEGYLSIILWLKQKQNNNY